MFAALLSAYIRSSLFIISFAVIHPLTCDRCDSSIDSSRISLACRFDVSSTSSFFTAFTSPRRVRTSSTSSFQLWKFFPSSFGKLDTGPTGGKFGGPPDAGISSLPVLVLSDLLSIAQLYSYSRLYALAVNLLETEVEFWMKFISQPLHYNWCSFIRVRPFYMRRSYNPSYLSYESHEVRY